MKTCKTCVSLTLMFGTRTMCAECMMVKYFENMIPPQTLFTSHVLTATKPKRRWEWDGDE